MRPILIALLVVCPLAPGGAQEMADGQRSPGDLTIEERREMMQHASDYNACVYNAAIADIDKHPDIRQIADEALGACVERLDVLNETITAWGFPSGFAAGFTRSVRDRAVRQLLPELAVRKGS
ncbi:MAG: hypothetical protein WD928_08390 [Gammaproteobacteria bacterium]